MPRVSSSSCLSSRHRTASGVGAGASLRVHAPDAILLAFAQSTYAAGASLAGWDRVALARYACDPHEEQGWLKGWPQRWLGSGGRRSRSRRSGTIHSSEE
jgi:hypothetical protein